MNPLDRHTLVRESKLKYLHDDFVLVEEIAKDGTRLFPHTEQLPKILKAVEREFFEGIPAFYAKTDHRADDQRKYTLWKLTLRFCDLVNVFRQDGLILHSVLQRDMVARVAVVQRIAEPHPMGICHRFRYFANGAFFPDVHISGKRVGLSTHFLERYRERVAKLERTPMTSLLGFMQNSSGYVMRVNSRDSALMVWHDGPLDEATDKPKRTIAALAFDESETDFFFTTVLTVNEIHALEPVEPARVLDSHYGRHFPQRVHYNFQDFFPQKEVVAIWRQKIPAAIPQLETSPQASRAGWDRVARQLVGKTGKNFRTGWRMAFNGNYHSTGWCYVTEQEIADGRVLPPEGGPV